MVIQQTEQPASIWVKTLLEAVSKNFAIEREFKCSSYFEDNENIAKSVSAKLMTEKFGDHFAISEINRLWPNNSYESLMSNKSLGTVRTRCKINLIQNYFKFYGN